jgi:hypothetical protein
MADERNSELRKCSAADAVATGHGHGEPVNDWEPCRAPRCGCSHADSGRDVDAVEACDDTYCDDAVAPSHQAACHAIASTDALTALSRSRTLGSAAIAPDTVLAAGRRPIGCRREQKAHLRTAHCTAACRKVTTAC